MGARLLEFSSSARQRLSLSRSPVNYRRDNRVSKFTFASRVVPSRSLARSLARSRRDTIVALHLFVGDRAETPYVT